MADYANANPPYGLVRFFMSADQDSSIEVYVRLLNEGTQVYRPVPSRRMADDVFLLRGDDIYNREDEEWEFEPGSAVKVIEKEFARGRGLLAVARAK
jgi:hypothetical protein